MRTEEQTPANQRYLYSDEYFSDKATSIWQEECIKRCKDKNKGEEYEKYINWSRQKDEVVVYTLYAYADFSIPKKFDIIFQIDKPENYINEEYEMTQVIYEAWIPSNRVEHGHKHLCIFKFKNEIPPIFNILHIATEKSSTVPTEHKALGFCNSTDFQAIKKRIQEVLELRSKYGDKWWEFDIE